MLALALGVTIAEGQVTESKSKNGLSKARKVLVPGVYLGRSTYSRGEIRLHILDSLLRQGLTSKDSLGNSYKVTGFDFGYSERKLYEDERANLLVMSDYFSVHCLGDTLPHSLVSAGADLITGDEMPGIYQRLKPGDTLYFDNVSLRRMNKKNNNALDTLAILGKSMKFTITK